jgi:D-alanine-D-alanine ligase
MIVGLTYDLRSEYLKEGYSQEETAEFDKEDTIEGIEAGIQKMGHTTERIGNIKQLVNKLAAGKRWDLVFNIAEGMYGISREAQVPALLDAYKIPYVFSDALVLTATLNKSVTKRLVRDLGIATPDFAVVKSVSDVKKIKLPFPLFAKPIAEGTGKGITANSKIVNKKQLEEVCAELLVKFNQPVLVETFLSGREFTIGVVGNGNKGRVIGGMEIVFGELAEQDVYSFYNKENYENRIHYHKLEDKKILKECTDLVLASWNGLDCKDGGRVDVRMDDKGIVNFIEVNPLAGLHPIHSDLVIIAKMNGIDHSQLIGLIMQAALERHNLKQ